MERKRRWRRRWGGGGDLTTRKATDMKAMGKAYAAEVGAEELYDNKCDGHESITGIFLGSGN